ncbi:MAG: DUF4846 domain-containing protein [Bacteroidota bacterium]
MKPLYLSLLIFSCTSPDSPSSPEPSVAPATPVAYVDPTGRTIATRFPTPEGYVRTSFSEGSFPHFLRHQPLKPHGTKVHLFSGLEKSNQLAHAAVLDVDVENRDLQQCADAIMRLRAEYLYTIKQYDDIHFNFVSGFNAEYRRWRKGERIRVKGNKVSWVAGQSASTDYASFRKYLTMVFSYAGTASLAKELQPKSLALIEIGDVFIRGGFPGHAVIVVDKITNTVTGEVQVLLAQSYMPAQDIHVLSNPIHRGDNPWYSIQDMQEVVHTAEYTFQPDELKAFVK